MKKNYEKPIIEIVKFQEAAIETGEGSSTQDVGVGDWWEE
jgi:hypothetical protein